MKAHDRPPASLPLDGEVTMSKNTDNVFAPRVNHPGQGGLARGARLPASRKLG